MPLPAIVSDPKVMMGKPVIAAINGIALGAGMDLALACDLRFAAADARMGENYSKVGLVPGAGGAYFLPSGYPGSRPSKATIRSIAPDSSSEPKIQPDMTTAPRSTRSQVKRK